MRFTVSAVVLVASLVGAGSASGVEIVRPRIRVQLGADAPARAGQTVPVEIRLTDDAGGPIDTAVALDVDVGKAAPPERTAPGVYRTVVTVPRRLPSVRTMVLLTRASASTLETSLALGPGPAAALRLDGPSACPEDAEICRIAVWAEDADGNPAEEVPVATAGLGRISPASWAEAGRWAFLYRPPRVDRERSDRVTVELGKLRATHDLVLAPARTRIGFAPLVGVARQANRNGFAVGGQVIGQRWLSSGWLVGAGMEVSWWSVTKEGTASGLAVSTDRSQTGVKLLLTAERALAGRLTGMLTLGGGAVRVASTNHVEGQPGVTDSGYAPVVSASGGLGWRFKVGMPFLEVRQGWVGDAHLLTDPGATWPLQLRVGFRLDVR